MAHYTSYRVKQGDTLEAIAALYLGGLDHWSDLAALNRLRAPYISDDPADRYGDPLWEGVLPTALPAGSTRVVLPALDPLVAVPGTQFYVETMTLNGPTGEAVLIEAVVPPSGFAQPTNDPAIGVVYTGAGAPGAGQVTFATALLGAYPANAYCAVTPPPFPSAYRVLQTGDLLYLPAADQPTGVVAAGTRGQFIDLFGVDLMLTATGDLATANGDLATVGGLPNLHQALALRFGSERGDLPAHPKYGNPLAALLGKSVTGPILSLGAAMAAQLAVADPRIARAQAVSVSLAAPDVLAVQLALTARSTAETFRLDLNAPLLGIAGN
jgi:hypothetical protein